MKPKTVSVTIGQYADFFSMSDMSFMASCDCCGGRSTWVIKSRYSDARHLCDGCHFRHTVMKAAGREQEFWDAAEKSEYNQTVGSVAREMSYRMAASVDAMVRATVDSGLSGK